MCLVAMILGAGFLIYRFGFDVHPHHVGFAVLLAAVYVIVSGGGYGFVYRMQMRAARRL
jgi:hypothetical protein